jgi:thiamine biosynthesis protein ThiI
MQNTYLMLSINRLIRLKGLFEARDMAQRMPKLLVRYGELGLKSPSVRRRFENALIDDIRKRHALGGVPCVISSTRGRIFVDSDNWRRSSEIITRTFGVVSFSPVTEVASDIETLTKSTVEFSDQLMFDGASFAIRTRRTGNHSYTSQTLAEKLGSAVLEKHRPRGAKVSLETPDVEIFVEVRDKKAYLYSSALSGPGGMPLGTQGRLLSVVDSEEGLAASWLMMKRGCSVINSTSDASIIEPLGKWYPNLKIVEPGKDIFEQAKELDCIGIALDWTLKKIEESKPPKGDLPVFYPLVGMSKEEIMGLMDRVRA